MKHNYVLKMHHNSITIELMEMQFIIVARIGVPAGGWLAGLSVGRLIGWTNKLTHNPHAHNNQ